MCHNTRFVLLGGLCEANIVQSIEGCGFEPG